MVKDGHTGVSLQNRRNSETNEWTFYFYYYGESTLVTFLIDVLLDIL